MIVKIHARGAGRGSGATGYLLGDYEVEIREDATLLRGDPKDIQDLCDSSPYAQKYTSGVLSFEEEDIPEKQKQLLMDDFESTLLAGLDHDQYSVLWVEHKDKGRLELNFVIPNVELQTGKRLQPYFDRVDRPLVNAWKDCANHLYGFSDPNDPDKHRHLVTANDLPKDKQALSEAITEWAWSGIQSGKITDRESLVEALTERGLTVARQVKGSISIADPDGGKNIRLKGEIYEQNFRVDSSLRERIEAARKEYRDSSKERFSSARESLENHRGKKREYLQERYPKPRGASEAVRHESGQNQLHMGDGQRDVSRSEHSHDRPANVGGVEVKRDENNRRQLRESFKHVSGTQLQRGGERADVGELALRPDHERQEHPRERLESHRPENKNGITENDRDRTTLIERIRNVTGRAKQGIEQLNDRVRGFKERVNQFSESGHVFKLSTSHRATENQRTDQRISEATNAVKSFNESLSVAVQQQERESRTQRQGGMSM